MVDTESKMAWYVVRSQPKRERIAAANLRSQLGLEVLCPLVRYVKVTRRGKVWWSEAMFPGYLFARFDRMLHERAVRYAQGVMTVVQFGENMPEVPENFLHMIQEGLGGDEVVVLSRMVQPGDVLEVAHGPLAGQSGDVIEVLPGAERVKLLIEFLGGAREVVLDLYSLLLPERPDSER